MGYCYYSADERRLELSSAPLDMEHDNNRANRGIYSHSLQHTIYNIQHNPYNTYSRTVSEMFIRWANICVCQLRVLNKENI